MNEKESFNLLLIKGISLLIAMSINLLSYYLTFKDFSTTYQLKTLLGIAIFIQYLVLNDLFKHIYYHLKITKRGSIKNVFAY